MVNTRFNTHSTATWQADFTKILVQYKTVTKDQLAKLVQKYYLYFKQFGYSQLEDGIFRVGCTIRTADERECC